MDEQERLRLLARIDQLDKLKRRDEVVSPELFSADESPEDESAVSPEIIDMIVSEQVRQPYKGDGVDMPTDMDEELSKLQLQKEDEDKLRELVEMKKRQLMGISDPQMVPPSPSYGDTMEVINFPKKR